ncbi:MAG: HD domain-containing protein [Calditrichia bacterium]|nr:HD domain-containing protein [Calditrichia bacterium]
MFDRKQKLQRIIQLGLEISQIKDLDILLEKVLTEAKKLVDADAGSLYIIEDNKLKFSYSQNDTLVKKLTKGRKLIYTTFSMPINNNSIAGFVANNSVLLNIPDAYEISANNPFSFDSSYDKKVGYETHSMLTAPLKNVRGECVGVLQLINAMDNGEIIPFSEDDEPLIKHFANYAATAIERAQMTRTTIMRMISMAELRDPKETGPHVNRVASYAVEIYETWAQKKGMDSDEIDKQRDALRMAAMLHDVGKVAISDTILKKPGKFDDEEYEIMKQHTWMGARLFADARSDFDEIAAEVAQHHHERWDGKGYPGYIDVSTGEALQNYLDDQGKAKAKKGEDIPIFGRVVALADVYDALCSKRVYKEAWDEEKVLELIKEETGKQFDPEIVEAFFETIDVIRSIAQRYPDQQD